VAREPTPASVAGMKVAGLWRYPVKSMQGEATDSVGLDESGVDGDRRFGVLDAASGTIVSAKKDGRLLEARAMLAGVELTVQLPTGETALGTGPAVDAALSAWLGRTVHLVEARPDGRGTFERPEDFEDDGSEPVQWQGPYGSFVDSSPVHLLTTASLRAMSAERPDLRWDVLRFRPNVLIEADGTDCVEDAWVGRRVVLGQVELEVRKACGRCVMTTRPQPGGLRRELDIMRHLSATRSTNLGVLARVTRGGRVDVGQPATL
jgi:MOSC domain-containing protein